MNLLTAPWLPFKLRSGTIEYRVPTAIADPDVIDVAMPRADFQGAAYQWLIGLLQTAMPPDDHYGWLDCVECSPDTQTLEQAFEPLAPAFEFDGDGPRFMQDLDPLDDAELAAVSGLLIDAPGVNGIKNNTDLFIKRGRVSALCADCAAMALFTLQINAPSGGAGYRVGLRGGGPLTTLVLPEDAESSLWRRLWLNVLSRSVAGRGGNGATAVAVDDAALFAWMGPTRTSKSKGSEVLPDSVHPLHAYWAMPRRYRLVLESGACACDLCGRQVDASVRELRAKNYGMNYDGPWQHPLTPYRLDPKKPKQPPLSTKGQPGGVGYQHWSHLVLPDEVSGAEVPATVVHDFLNGKYDAVHQERQAGATDESLMRQARLWAFGYDMDNMKPRCWYSVEMPLVAVDPEQQALLRAWVVQFAVLAREAAWATRTQVKTAWFKRPKDAKGDMSDVDQQLYEATQAAFFSALRRMGEALAEDDVPVHVPSPIARDWFTVLRQQSLQLFDDRALSGPLAELDMKRLIRARQSLLFWWRRSGKRKGTAAKFAEWGGFDTEVNAPEHDKEAAHE